ncbi:ZIP family metal transporter [Mesomycoplasma molare]|uniref:ZIP family metal transporter n=1 Tax=Mesomycoplasma molare TaxID=171288 RepID=A0ABY5TYJ2_9BACT|nr:ZIP family metal transporter [Mesomycoplasma molare]UWD34104.1 ZIP family metal transporter [Mesomycoplasma molare]
MFPFKSQNFNGNIDLAILVNLIIYISILLVIPISIVLLIAKIKPTIKKSTNIYLYALSAGMLLIIGTVGFLRESYEVLERNIHEQAYLADFLEANELNEQFLVLLIVGSGSFIGISSIFVVRYFFVRFFGVSESHQNHDEHGHHDHIVNFADIDNPKSAWLAILLLLSHRTIDGFILGATVAKMSSGEPLNIGLIVTFNIHIIIEILIVYYRQVQYGQTIKKAVIYNLITTLLLVPIMTIGAFINRFLNSVWWLLPLINSSGGSILTFVVVIELTPEFIHLRNRTKKEWYLALIAFAIGIIMTLMLLAFHSHS